MGMTADSDVVPGIEGIDKRAWHSFDMLGYGPAFEVGHVNRCITDARNAFRTLEEARSSGDTQMARDAVHSLRGIASILGLAPLGERLRQLTETIKESGPGLAPDLVDGLRREVREGVLVIARWRRLPEAELHVEQLPH